MDKREKYFTRVLLIVLIVLVGIIFIYNYVQDKNLDKNAKEEVSTEKEDKPKEEEIKLDSEEVKSALKSFDDISGIDKYKDFDVTKLDKYRLILTAINGLDDYQISWCISSIKQITATITIEELNEALHKYIKDQEITIDDIKNSKGETGLTVGKYGFDSYAISIDTDNSIHVIGSCSGRDAGITKEVARTNLIKAIKKDDDMYIYMNVAYGKLNSTANALSYDYYTEFEKTNFQETVSLDDNLTWDKYKTYKQIYKKIGDKYYFISSKIE